VNSIRLWRQSTDGRPNVVSRRPRKIERKLYRLRYWPWFRGKQLTTDWASEHFTLWHRVLSPLRKKPLRILEIGSWEGRSALFFLNFFPHATITCIDTFEGGREHHKRTDWAGKLPGIEERFDHNLAPFGSRTEKLKCLSQEGLRRLVEQQRRYDLAYIDGSHVPADVAADSIGVWPLIEPSGVIIWDDYKFGVVHGNLPLDQRPQSAIDAFLSEHDGSYRLLWSGYQLIIEKHVR
jgi:predicted O-methyltransferase YrrM